MRIAHVTDVYLPRLGGVELQVHDLAAHQRAIGHEPLVITTTALGLVPSSPSKDRGAAPERAGEPERGAVPVLRLGQAMFTIGLGPYRAIREHALREALHAHGAEVVHAHVSAFSPLAWTVARLAAADGIPTVVSVHSMWHDVVPLVRRYARWQRAASWPVEWAAVSRAAATAVRDALDGTPVSVLPNGIEPADWLLPARPAAAVPTIVSVMRMVRRKRPRALLRMLLALGAGRSGRFRAVLVGDGPLLPRLRRELAAAGGPDTGIELPGARDRGAIRSLLASADLYLAPASRESFGIAALEARSAGLPVVARGGSGIADFVEHTVEGWLVGSDQEMYTTVDALLDDPRRLAAVARHNRAVAPRVQWDSVLATAEARYEAATRRQVDRPLRAMVGAR